MPTQVTSIRQGEIPSRVEVDYRDAFEAAIRKAIAAWRCSPATRRTFVNAPDDGSGKPPYRVLESEVPAPTYFDIRFTFEVHDSKGVFQGGR